MLLVAEYVREKTFASPGVPSCMISASFANRTGHNTPRTTSCTASSCTCWCPQACAKPTSCSLRSGTNRRAGTRWSIVPRHKTWPSVWCDIVRSETSRNQLTGVQHGDSMTHGKHKVGDVIVSAAWVRYEAVTTRVLWHHVSFAAIFKTVELTMNVQANDRNVYLIAKPWTWMTRGPCLSRTLVNCIKDLVCRTASMDRHKKRNMSSFFTYSRGRLPTWSQGAMQPPMGNDDVKAVWCGNLCFPVTIFQQQHLWERLTKKRTNWAS